MQASASPACRKVDGHVRLKTDFSAFLRYVGLGSQAVVELSAAPPPFSRCQPTSRQLQGGSAKAQRREVTCCLALLERYAIEPNQREPPLTTTAWRYSK